MSCRSYNRRYCFLAPQRELVPGENMTENNSDPSIKKHHGHLARVIEQNIHTIVHSRQSAASQRNAEERVADTITDFSGRMYFVYFHIVWFAVWILINLGNFGIRPFDPYPFGLLTMIV